ncbi:hypothetical protein ACIQLJ_11335 [Microbacterium sp. NPDC091313]
MSTPPDDRPARTAARWRQWLPAAFDRIPTGWFATALTGAFLAVTAAFGGLNAVAAPTIPELSAGETHTSAQFDVTVERAVLIDSLDDAGVTVEAGQRVLAVVATVVNRWERPVSSGDDGGLGSVVRVPALGDEPAASVARFDDTTSGPWFQPGVPAQVVLTWAVDRSTLRDTGIAEAADLRVQLRDLRLYTGSLVTYGQSWEDPVPAATVTVGLTDVGAGADAEDAG